jgi:hypothetical protein
MSFQPTAGDRLEIGGRTYRIAEHPNAPGVPYGQEGRAAIVYQLLAKGGPQALKAFKTTFRAATQVPLAERLAALASLPGLQACHRVVLTPQRHAALLQQYPELSYAVLMPWVQGPTWQEVLQEQRSLRREDSLSFGGALAEVLWRMEQAGVAHCDLSGPNVLLPALDGGAGIALVDIEQLYAPGLEQPSMLTSNSDGYAQRAAAKEELWSAVGDRFAGAVLLAEMLGWYDARVRKMAWGEHYFEQREMQQDGARYDTLLRALREGWGEESARLLARAWQSNTLHECPTFGEWVVALPARTRESAAAVMEAAIVPEGIADKPIVTVQKEVVAADQRPRAWKKLADVAEQPRQSRRNLAGWALFGVAGMLLIVLGLWGATLGGSHNPVVVFEPASATLASERSQLSSVPTELANAADTPTNDASAGGAQSATVRATASVAIQDLNAGFVADVTIPDGQWVAPEQALVKTWRIRNTGAVAWPAGTKLVFVSGTPLGTVDAVPVRPLAVGKERTVTVPLVAPRQAGNYVAVWQLQTDDGRAFGVKLTVVINVGAGQTTGSPDADVARGNCDSTAAATQEAFAEIVYPAEGSTVWPQDGVVQIIGTASGRSFTRYTVAWGYALASCKCWEDERCCTPWVRFEKQERKECDVLFTIDTSGWAPDPQGRYEVHISLHSVKPDANYHEVRHTFWVAR